MQWDTERSHSNNPALGCVVYLCMVSMRHPGVQDPRVTSYLSLMEDDGSEGWLSRARVAAGELAARLRRALNPPISAQRTKRTGTRSTRQGRVRA